MERRHNRRARAAATPTVPPALYGGTALAKGISWAMRLGRFLVAMSLLTTTMRHRTAVPLAPARQDSGGSRVLLQAGAAA